MNEDKGPEEQPEAQAEDEVKPRKDCRTCYGDGMVMAKVMLGTDRVRPKKAHWAMVKGERVRVPAVKKAPAKKMPKKIFIECHCLAGRQARKAAFEMFKKNRQLPPFKILPSFQYPSRKEIKSWR